MERDQAESLLTSLKKLFDHLKERKVNLSHAPKQNDDESNCMFWTLTGAIRDIWKETEDIIGAELRGTKLLTSTWLHASDICNGKVDVLDYDNKEVFGTESRLSDEMTKCVEEARHAVTTFVQMKKELEQMKKEKASRLYSSASSHIEEDKKKLKHFIETSLKKAKSLHEIVLSSQFEETPDIKVKLFEKCNGNDLIYSVFLTGNIIKRCFDKLHENHSTLLEDTCSHGSDADQQTKAPNTCTDMDIDNDDQMPLVSNKYDQKESDFKQLQSEFEKLKKAEQDLLERYYQKESDFKQLQSDFEKVKKAEQDLLERYDQKESDFKQLQSEFEKVKKTEQDLFERKGSFNEQLEEQRSDIHRLKDVNTNLKSRIDYKDDLLKVKGKEIEELKSENGDYLARLDANGVLLKVKEKKIEKLKVEKEDYLSRLSQYTSAQLKQDNPNIADLSDSYRPTKLAERFSELYDNEWTDAFDVIKGRYRYSEEKAISSLLYILTQAYEFCRNSSKEQDQHLERILERNYSSSNITQKNAVASETELSCFERDVIHNLKKRAVESSAKSVKEDFLKQLQKSYWVLSDFEEPHVKAFALSCANICWHMVLHSPPLFIESGFMPGDSFSINKYKYYKTRGTRYKYIVWPVLYLHPEGDVLSKGVAEAE